MLTGHEIRRLLDRGELVINPPPQKIGSNSADLTLARALTVYGTEEDAKRLRYPNTIRLQGSEGDYVWCAAPCYRRVLDARKSNPTVSWNIPDDGQILLPGQLYLASSVEYTETYGFVPTIETRSSVARLGVMAHLAAGYGDCGFKGSWTLELVAFEPIRIYAGMRICQIAYSRTEGEQSEYTGKYNGQRGPVASRLHEDFPS